MPAPTLASLKQFLLERYSMTVTGDLTLQAALDAAVSRLETDTGYRPFLAAATVSAMDVVIEDGIAPLPNGAVGGLSVTGYTAGVHFRPVPFTAERAEAILWVHRQRPTAPVSVFARWGWGDDYPADLWQALVYFAASDVIVGRLIGDVSSKGSKWTDGDVSVSYADASSRSLSSLTGGQLRAEATEVFRRYRRVAAWG